MRKSPQLWVVSALIIGSSERLQALKEAIGDSWEAHYEAWPSAHTLSWGKYALVIDLEADERPSPAFSLPEGSFWALQAVKKPLYQMLHGPEWYGRCVGINLLPGFCTRKDASGRPLLEISALSAEALRQFHTLMPQAQICEVPDEVGMVSPRILSLIINEAFLLAEETQIPIQEIDTAVKLGLNYPRTIQEWGAWMGWRHVREVLLALQAHYGADHYPLAARLRSLEGLSQAPPP